MPAIEAEERPAEEAAGEVDKAAQLKVQAAHAQNGDGAANGDSGDEVKRLQDENERLQAKVTEQEKEIEGLKVDVQKYKDESEGKRKRTSSTSKGKTGLFGRKKKNAEDQPQQAETSPEVEAAPQTEEGAGSAEDAPAAAANGDEAAANETDTAAVASEGESTDKTPKKKGGIKDRLGRAFGRFRHPKGYEETPKDEPEEAAKTDELQIPERKQVTWTVAKSFEKPAEPVEGEGEQAEAAAKPEGEGVTAFKDWTAEAVREWLTDLQLERYADACKLTGEQMLKTTDAQFEKDLGVRNFLHRKKLRLTLNAIASGADLPKELVSWDIKAVVDLLRYHGIPDSVVGLFVENSIDGRVLTFLTMDDMTGIKITSPHSQACIKRAIQLWRKHNYNGDYMKTFVEPEPLAEEEEEEAPAEAAAEDSKPEAEAAAAEKPADAEKEEEKPSVEGEKAEGEQPAEKTEDEKKAEEEKAATEKKAEEERKAAEEAKKKEEAEKRKAEATKRRQQRYFELSLTALKEQKEIVTWSNTDVMVWARAAGLADNAHHLACSGVSGALMVLDVCCTSDTLCSAFALAAKDAAHRELVGQKLSELLGEEVMGEKAEASKLENYAALIPGARAKRKRTLSFSSARRRKQRGEKPAPPSIYLCSMDEVPTGFVEAHTKDCSIPLPAPEEEAATAEAVNEGDKVEGEKAEGEKAEGGEEKKEEKAEDSGEASPKTDEETAPLVEKEKEEEKKDEEERKEEVAEVKEEPVEAPQAAVEEEKKEDATTEKSKLLAEDGAEES